jgi:hypothetical protein
VAAVSSAIATVLAAPPARSTAAPKPVDRFPGTRALLTHRHALVAAREAIDRLIDEHLSGADNPSTVRMSAGMAAAEAWSSLTDEQRAATVAQLNRPVRNALRTGRTTTPRTPSAGSNGSGTGQGGARSNRDWSGFIGETVTFKTGGVEHHGEILDGGQVSLNGETYKSATAAALSVNGGTSVNGLKVWRLSDGRTLQDAVPTVA